MVEPRMTQILLIVLTAALGASLVFGEVRVRGWKSLYEEVHDIYEDTQQQMVEAQVEVERAHSEMAFLKELFNRPLVCTLSDVQAQGLTQAVLSYLESLKKDLNQMN